MFSGIPVSQGIVKGYARVALTIEEAALLKVSFQPLKHLPSANEIL